MTDKFLKMFISQKPIQITEYAVFGEVYFIADHWIMSNKTYLNYLNWEKTMPALLKELV